MDLFKRASFRHGEGTIVTCNDVSIVQPDRPMSTFQLAVPPIQRKETSEILNSEVNNVDGERQTKDSYRFYPNVPYYGLLQGIDVHIDIDSAATSSSTASSSLNPSNMAGCISQLHDTLCDAVNRYGDFYYTGNSLLPLFDATPASAMALSTTTQSSSAAVGTSAGTFSGPFIVYEVYLHALIELFQGMSRVRDRCCAPDPTSTSDSDGGPSKALPGGPVLHTHHVVYLRIANHPSLKDVNVMLAIERGRMVLFVSTSSRMTRAYLSAQAQKVLLELRWVSGAVLVWEPDQLRLGEVNPVFALWDVLVNTPLMASVGLADAGSVESPGPADAVQEVLSRVMPLTGRVVEGFGWIVLSSLPFSGAQQCRPTLRLQDPVALRVARAPNALGNPIMGRRYGWRLVGPFRNVVLPHLFTHISQCLVNFEHDGHRLRSFTVRTQSGAQEEYGEHRNPQSRTGPESGGVTGLSYIRSERSGLTTRRGPSSQSWMGFSRLSGNDWLSDEEREQLGLLVVENEEEVALECEFSLAEIRYCNMAANDNAAEKRKGQLRKRPRSPLLLQDSMENTMSRCSLSGFAHGAANLFSVDNPEDWGQCFDWNISVTRLLDYTDSESDMDG
ncbi:unnamed protein product [Phytomonas sp. Hart1]|nr:unnamed protein product [Phytomonas sp. Hart1]|eukprot:CCW66563.1 unnamed protein product [Phytomonas sp. isolate Hart1]